MRRFQKIIAGDEVRRTRFHTRNGDLVKGSAVWGLWPALWTWLWLRFTGRTSWSPWWVYSATRHVGNLVRADDEVIEVGSGASTIWLANKCKSVVTVEENPEWAAIVEKAARRARLENVHLHIGDSARLLNDLVTTREHTAIVIDGPGERKAMIESVFFHDRSRLPRWIVYDDTDRSEYELAPETIPTMYERKTFRGFKPYTIHACETTVFQLKSPKREDH